MKTKQYKMYYVSLPVLVNWQMLNNFSLLAGPQFDLLINGDDKTDNNTASLEREIEHRSIFFIGGLEYAITENLVSGVRYMHGFNHIGINRETGYEEFKYDGVQISLSYLF
ncbi:PorT family protein [Antarcticibacterium sp. 1MA-6-2]|nr:outer membrane beta-barrel protein [Antarcticibacterium sp. 1MA-6-2]UJH91729.1 PorT family protein [Antarcticibacterium sp. 1MA-6-2]